MNATDDRTQAWQAAHDMTDPRNQLPTEAQRQGYSAERLAAGFRELSPAQQRAILTKHVDYLKAAGAELPPELERYATKPQPPIIAALKAWLGF